MHASVKMPEKFEFPGGPKNETALPSKEKSLCRECAVPKTGPSGGPKNGTVFFGTARSCFYKA